MTLSVSNNPLWRCLKKVLKEEAPLYLEFQIQSRKWGLFHTVCQGFPPPCVVDYGLGSLSYMLRRHIATCIATWGRPTACPKLRAYWPTTCVLFSSGSQRRGCYLRNAGSMGWAGEDICPANVCAITFIIDVTATVPASNVLAACKFGTGIFHWHLVPGAGTSFISYVSPFLLLSPLASFPQDMGTGLYKPELVFSRPLLRVLRVEKRDGRFTNPHF